VNKKMKIAVVLGLLIVALAASVFFQVYFIRDACGGTMFWKEDEAYLFLGASQTGHHFSYLEYPLALIAEYFYAAPPPKDQTAFTIVVHVNPSGMQRQILDLSENTLGSPAFLTPFDDGFYGMCRGGVLCKWTGSSFELATAEEQQRLDGINCLARGGTKFVNGWHVRDVAGLPGEHFEVKIGSDIVISAQNLATNPRAYPWVSVTMTRPSQALESLYNIDGTPRRVSRSEYERTFGNR